MLKIILAYLIVITTSCNKFEEGIITPSAITTQRIFFTADKEEYTRLVLDTDDDITFQSHWDNEDLIGVEAVKDRVSNSFTASWSSNNNQFYIDVESASTGQTYNIRAIYPYNDSNIKKLDFGSPRPMSGNTFNQAYDLMISDFQEVQLSGEKDPHKFDMHRLTAIQYFHFTSNLSNEKVLSASLECTPSTESDFINADAIIINNNSSNYSLTKGNNKISLQFDIDKAPFATDFKLWFNTIPASFSAYRLIVNTENYSLVMNNTKGGTHQAGVVYVVNTTVPATAWKKREKATNYSWTEVTSVSSIHPGDYVIIASKDYNKAMSTLQKTNNRGETNVTIESSVLTANDDVQVFLLEEGTKSGSFAFNTKFSSSEVISFTEGYIQAASSGANYLHTQSTKNDNASWIITISNNTTSIVSQGSYTRNDLKYNSSSSLFSCYGSDNKQLPVTLYKRGNQIGKLPQKISFIAEEHEVFMKSGTTYDGLTLTGNKTTVSYASSNTSIATVNSSTGKITPKKIGSCIITATAQENEDYASATATYTLNVVAAPVTEKVNTNGWLVNYEIPYVDNINMTPNTETTNLVAEGFGTTKAYVYTISNAEQALVTHTYPYDGQTLRNYTLLFEKKYKTALWVAYPMYPSIRNNVGRNDGWSYDPAIPEAWQAKIKKGYQSKDGISYDRGHQMASNDSQCTIDGNKQTFYFSNMTPQASFLNQQTWQSLESDVQKLADNCTASQKLFVVTGPIFDSKPAVAQDNNGVDCPVPAQYYKCVIRCTFENATSNKIIKAEGAAFLFENVSKAPRQITTIDNIEKLTGFDFFANIPDDLESSAESNTTILN